MRRVVSLMLATLVTLSGCSTVNTSISGMIKWGSSDSVPGGATPKHEPIHKPATRPYTIRGITYYPQKHPSEPYDEVGLASWYGHPFHGRKTANGEIFDKDRISAAHKTLTIPSYVKVTVLETGKSMIIRVNDRGPFEKGRIIDLSEGAAKALGVHRKGLAKVRVQKINPDKIVESDIESESVAEVAFESNLEFGTHNLREFEAPIRVRRHF